MAQAIRIPPQATYKYPRIVWNGNTFDFPDALISAIPETAPVVGSAIAASGARQTVYEHTETAVTIITPIMDPAATDQMERFIREWGQYGQQFEFYLDRFLRSYWGFQQHLKDNNLVNPFVVGSKDSPQGNDTGDVPAYAALTLGYGITVPTAANRALRASLISGLNALNNFVSADATEGGVIALLFKPTWAQTDSAEHYLLDLAIPGSLTGNRIRLIKGADNVTRLRYTGANGCSTVIESTTSWSAGDEVTVLAQYGQLTDLKLSVQGVVAATLKYSKTFGGGKKYGAVHKFGQTTGTPSGNEQTLGTAPTRATLGSDELVLGGKMGASVGLLSLYRGRYTGALNPILGTYRYPWRTYYPRAELADPSFRATRIVSGRELFTYQLRIRDGV